MSKRLCALSLEDVREIMATLGFRTINEMVGRTDLLTQSDIAKEHWKAKYLDLSRILYQPSSNKDGVFNRRKQNHGLEKSLDVQELLSICQPALEMKAKSEGKFYDSKHK